jgi:hypothetical protein
VLPLPQMITVSTFGLGMGTGSAGLLQLFGVLANATDVKGLIMVTASLPMVMLSWYLYAVNDIVQKIQASSGTPAQQLAEVQGTLGPIMALLKIPEKVAGLGA